MNSEYVISPFGRGGIEMTSEILCCGSWSAAWEVTKSLVHVSNSFVCPSCSIWFEGFQTNWLGCVTVKMTVRSEIPNEYGSH